MFRYQLCFLSLFGLLLFSGCKMNYSFTGASIPPEVKTISIDYFENNAPLIQPTLSQLFTEALKDKFLSETNLTLISANGDFNLEGSIIGYSISPVAIQGNETAALNRLTITVKVKFTNTKDEKQNFESSLTRFEEYESSLQLSDAEEDLNNLINEQIIEDIFNKTVVNW